MLHRRELLKLGSLSILAPAAARAGHDVAAGGSFGRARACIFLMLQGGPSHLDLWDPKPAAPLEIRGPFEPIATRGSGIAFGSPLPKTAMIADRLCVIRSMTHRFNNHIAGTYIMLTGSEDQPNQDREAHGDDFPGPGAVLNVLDQRPGSAPKSVALPTWLSIPGPSNRMPGQYGGFLGSLRDPFLIAGEPEKPDFKPLSLSLPEGFTLDRMRNRWELHSAIDGLARATEDRLTANYDRLAESAYELLTAPAVREALELHREPDSTRERYGRTRIGQSLLLARRLVEAGVRFVQYNAFNQQWDTHHNIAANYPNLVPPLDQAFAALVEDLNERGLLDATLVVNAGEFGRTPVINADGGRDHWPDVYSVALAGGGVRGGSVYGASDSRGTFVDRDPVAPADLLATMWHLLGIEPESTLRDRFERPIPLSRGRVMQDWLS
jgi:hypothetical protein